MLKVAPDMATLPMVGGMAVPATLIVPALFKLAVFQLSPGQSGGRLVGVLSRAVVQRRLAEDDEPAEDQAGEEAVVL